MILKYVYVHLLTQCNFFWSSFWRQSPSPSKKRPVNEGPKRRDYGIGAIDCGDDNDDDSLVSMSQERLIEILEGKESDLENSYAIGIGALWRTHQSEAKCWDQCRRNSSLKSTPWLEQCTCLLDDTYPLHNYVIMTESLCEETFFTFHSSRLHWILFRALLGFSEIPEYCAEFSEGLQKLWIPIH